jgi:outer membrane protein insertion porin family
LRSSAGLEFVIQLPVVNAPFRIYWAYNWLRVRDQIVEPAGNYFISDALKNALPGGVLDSQLIPRLDALITSNIGRGTPFEPLKTFRFTVSRTF